MQKNLQKNNLFKIGNFLLNKKKTFIIAEISTNHNKSLNRVKSLIKKAKECGADAVKLQTYKPDSITINSNNKDFSLKHLKGSKWSKYRNYYSLYEEGTLPWNWYSKIFKFAKKTNIEIFSSPFDESAVDMLETLNCVSYKIASPEINHIPLLIKVAKTKKPIIISTGLANLKDIDYAIKILIKYGNKKIALLKCNTSYPAPINESNIRNILYLSKKYNLPIGLSDHSIGNTASIAAVALGACIIEKHFNLDDKVKTLDDFFSTKAKDFKIMVKNIRETESLLGDYKYSISKSAIKNFRARRSIYVSKKIKKNDKINKENIKVVRPSMGLNPKFYYKILGKKSKKNLEKGTRLKLKYLK